MKMRLVLAQAWCASVLMLPAFAQQNTAAGPRMSQQRDLLGNATALDEFGELAVKETEAFANNDAQAVAALFADEALLLAPDGAFRGRQAIEQRYANTFRRTPFTIFTDPRERQLQGIDNAAWSAGEWWSTLQSQTGPVFVRGYWSAIYTRDGDRWKILVLTLGEYPPLTEPAPSNCSVTAAAQSAKS
jgi:ketosteroid isomerase-like protein